MNWSFAFVRRFLTHLVFTLLRARLSTCCSWRLEQSTNIQDFLHHDHLRRTMVSAARCVCVCMALSGISLVLIKPTCHWVTSAFRWEVGLRRRPQQKLDPRF